LLLDLKRVAILFSMPDRVLKKPTFAVISKEGTFDGRSMISKLNSCLRAASGDSYWSRLPPCHLRISYPVMSTKLSHVVEILDRYQSHDPPSLNSRPGSYRFRSSTVWTVMTLKWICSYHSTASSDTSKRDPHVSLESRYSGRHPSPKSFVPSRVRFAPQLGTAPELSRILSLQHASDLELETKTWMFSPYY